MTKPTTRLALLQLLKELGPRTATELAAAVGISAVAVRKHLDALEREGAVTVELVHQPIGRPVYRYALAAGADSYFPQRHRELLIALLQVLERERPHDLPRLLEAANAATLERYAAQLTGKPLHEQVVELARLRNEDGYLAKVGSEGNTLVLREYHCPIRDVAGQFPAACRCEADMFAALLDGRIESVATVIDGAPACEYRVAIPASTPA